MRKDRFLEWVREPEKLKAENKTDLEQVLQTFPWFQAGHFLYLSLLKSGDSFLFPEKLKSSAIFLPDRKKLFTSLENPFLKETFEESKMESESGSESEGMKESERESENQSESKMVSESGSEVESKSEREEKFENEELGKENGAESESESEEENENESENEELDQDPLKGIIVEEAFLRELEALPEIGIEEPESEVEAPEIEVKETESEFEEPELEIEEQDAVVESTKEEATTDENPKSFLDWLSVTPPLEKEEDYSDIEDDYDHEDWDEKEAEARFSKEEREKQEFFNPVNMARASVKDNEEIASETLAKIYTAQQNYQKAIDTYQKLILKNPEKKTYFAEQIEKLQTKI